MSKESTPSLQKNSLVLYKSNPALVLSIGQKIEIELSGKKKMSVREKDIVIIHPGPVVELCELDTLVAGEIEEACEMLSAETTTLEMFADLAYGSFTPTTAWNVCKLLQDGLYISGTPDKVAVHSRENREQIVRERSLKSDKRAAWSAFVQRVRDGKIGAEDRDKLVPLEDIAFGKTTQCKILKELALQQTATAAHALLLKLGVWDSMVNPYVRRLGFSLDVEYPEIGVVPQEERVDLTHLAAFAIDDEGNSDPDDAISIDGDKVWIHVADVASIVSPDSIVDLHARGHATTLYLPEKTVTMLPAGATEILGMGLQETSPALSFGVTLLGNGQIDSVEIVKSRVKVTRLTYSQAQDNLHAQPLKSLYKKSLAYREYRRSQGAVFLSFPEVKTKVIDGIVSVVPLAQMDTKDMVSDLMLMAGEAAAMFAVENEIPFPFSTQPAPEIIENPTSCSGMFSYRRQLKPSVIKSSPDQHACLGIRAYSRATSPLRRYLDLIAHQQIRAFLDNKPLLDEQEMMNRIGSSAALIGSAQTLERQSNLHWKMVYLLQNQDWKGKGVVVEIRDRYAALLIPEIALETRLSSPEKLSLDEEIEVGVMSVDLVGLTAHFRTV